MFLHVTSNTASSYLIHFKCACNFGEAHDHVPDFLVSGQSGDLNSALAPGGPPVQLGEDGGNDGAGADIFDPTSASTFS